MAYWKTTYCGVCVYGLPGAYDYDGRAPGLKIDLPSVNAKNACHASSSATTRIAIGAGTAVIDRKIIFSHFFRSKDKTPEIPYSNNSKPPWTERSEDIKYGSAS